MLAFPATVAAYVVLFVLVVAIAERVRAPGALPAALTVHGVLPRRAVRPVALAVTAAEVVLAAVLLVGLAGGAGPAPATVAGAAAAGAAVLFAGYGLYSRRALAAGGGPCGCGGIEVPMGRWVVVRAVALTALAALAAAGHGAVLPLDVVEPPLVVALLAAVTIGTLLWHLPAAMVDPAPDRHPEVVR